MSNMISAAQNPRARCVTLPLPSFNLPAVIPIEREIIHARVGPPRKVKICGVVLLLFHVELKTKS